MRTTTTIRPAGMASAVTLLAAATMLAACVASTGGPVPGPDEAPGLVQFRAAERAASSTAVSEQLSLAAFRAAERASGEDPTVAAALAAFRAGERAVGTAGVPSEAAALVTFRAGEREAGAAASSSAGAPGRYLR